MLHVALDFITFIMNKDMVYKKVCNQHKYANLYIMDAITYQFGTFNWCIHSCINWCIQVTSYLYKFETQILVIVCKRNIKIIFIIILYLN